MSEHILTIISNYPVGYRISWCTKGQDDAEDFVNLGQQSTGEEHAIASKAVADSDWFDGTDHFGFIFTYRESAEQALALANAALNKAAKPVLKEPLRPYPPCKPSKCRYNEYVIDHNVTIFGLLDFIKRKGITCSQKEMSLKIEEDGDEHFIVLQFVDVALEEQYAKDMQQYEADLAKYNVEYKQYLNDMKMWIEEQLLGKAD